MKIVAGGSIIVVALLFFFNVPERIGITWLRPMPSIANVEIRGSRLIVSDDSKTQTTYLAGKQGELTGTLIDYSYGGIGDFSKFGARGSVGFLTTPSYEELVADHQSTGECMANLLMDHGVPHLFLIPRNKEALRSMRGIIGVSGKSVTLVGQHLNFETSVIEGNTIGEPTGNMPIEYFLVDSIRGG